MAGNPHQPYDVVNELWRSTPIEMVEVAARQLTALDPAAPGWLLDLPEPYKPHELP